MDLNNQILIYKTDDGQTQIDVQVNDTINDTVNGTVNAQNLSVALGISLRTTKRDLYVLRDMNLIHYVGSDKTGHWEIIDNN